MVLFQFTGNLKDTGFAMRKKRPQRGAEPTPERCRLAVPAGEMARRAMAAAAWTVALAALLLPRAEAQLQAYTDNVTGYVAGSALITNAQCREVRALGHADALVETTPAEGRRRFLSPSARARDETEARVVSFVASARPSDGTATAEPRGDPRRRNRPRPARVRRSRPRFRTWPRPGGHDAPHERETTTTRRAALPRPSPSPPLPS